MKTAALAFPTWFWPIGVAIALISSAGVASAETLRHRIDVVDAWIRPPTKLDPEAKVFFTVINHTD